MTDDKKGEQCVFCKIISSLEQGWDERSSSSAWALTEAGGDGLRCEYDRDNLYTVV